MMLCFLIIFFGCQDKKDFTSAPLVNIEPAKEFYLRDNYIVITSALYQQQQVPH